MQTEQAICKFPNGGIGEQNEGNAENKGENARNENRMRVRGIRVGMQGIWMKIQKMRGIRVATRESKWKLKYISRNDME